MLVLPVAHLSAGVEYSLDMDSSLSQYLSMTASTFGWASINRDKWAISLWYKHATSPTAAKHFIGKRDTNSQPSFELYLDSSGKLRFVTYDASWNAAGSLTTQATFMDYSAWHHLMVHFDISLTSADRMKIYHDGVRITSFSSETQPSLSPGNGADAIMIGRFGLGGNYFNGQLYQVAFFSGTNPSVSDVYDSGSPKNISGVSGLHSLAAALDNNPSRDSKRSGVWTNNGSQGGVKSSGLTPW